MFINLFYQSRLQKIEFEKFRSREYNNYKEINHPFIPKFYGTTKSNNYLVVEYIYGHTLETADISTFSEKDIFSIIINILSVFKYLHANNFIYRDLKPSNVIIDSNKIAVLIDFDQMKKKNEEDNTTIDFASDFIAPEIISTGKFTDKSDIYSIGKIIDFIINKYKKANHFIVYQEINELISKCCNDKPDERPTILDIINKNIILNNVDRNNFFELGEFYPKNNAINRENQFFMLATNQNFQQSQFNLGNIYYEGDYITQNINEANYYLALTANQNDPEAQFNLGNIYYKGDYFARDINKAIHYWTLAANQNYPQAQFNLGTIYYEGDYITRNINKAIHYFTLSTNQNIPQAQYNLGAIYYNGDNITRDINKAIYYLTLAATQNIPQAQFNLGNIYYKGKYIAQDINKAIYYLTLAANQNIPQAQYNLGNIYYKGDYITRNINKAIHYYTLSANQNIPQAQFTLGIIYYKGDYIAQDINKAIHYYTLSAKQNNSEAQFNLGVIYYLIGTQKNINLGISWILESAKRGNINACFFIGFLYHEGKHINKDVKQSIHYYKEASSFNNQYAKNNLGIIYKHGIDNEIDKNSIAEEYFSESIKQKNDRVSMYNLAHFYIYEKGTAESIDKAIKLLIDLSNLEFYPSIILLLIVLFKKYDRNIDKIKNDLSKIYKKVLNHLFQRIEFELIISSFNDEKKLEEEYQYYKNIDFLYNQLFNVIETSHLYDFKNQKQQIVRQGKDINDDFYDGFNCDI